MSLTIQGNNKVMGSQQPGMARWWQGDGKAMAMRWHGDGKVTARATARRQQDNGKATTRRRQGPDAKDLGAHLHLTDRTLECFS